MFKQLIRKAKCPLNVFNEPDHRTFDCLTAFSSKQLFELSMLNSSVADQYAPAVDTHSPTCFFCRKLFDFEEVPLSLETSKNVLIGTNSMEGAMFVSMALPDVYPPIKGRPKNLTLNDLIKRAGNQQHIAGWLTERFFSDVDASNSTQVRQRLVDLLSDYLFVCPDKMLLDNWLKVKGEGRVYYYRLDYRSSKSLSNREWVFGANHADDIELVFGLPLLEEFKDHYNDYDRFVSENMVKLWKNFAEKGKLMHDLNERPTTYDEVVVGPSRYLLINSTGFSKQPGFPSNLCDVIDVDMYKSISSFLS